MGIRDEDAANNAATKVEQQDDEQNNGSTTLQPEFEEEGRRVSSAGLQYCGGFKETKLCNIL